MFDKRPENLQIEYTYLGNPKNLTYERKITDGDSVTIRHNNYEISIKDIKSIEDGCFFGTVEEIYDFNNKKTLRTIDKPFDINENQTIEFLEINIFTCKK
jgi:hypothetical protein